MANGSIITIEIFCTKPSIDDDLIDPITSVLFQQPVVMPNSGQSASLYVAENKSRVDVFTNVPFEPYEVMDLIQDHEFIVLILQISESNPQSQLATTGG